MQEQRIVRAGALLPLKQFLVTVKIAPAPWHNPRAKEAGECPVFGGFCSDITGAHHTTLLKAQGVEAVTHWAERAELKLTRIEEV